MAKSIKVTMANSIIVTLAITINVAKANLS